MTSGHRWDAFTTDRAIQGDSHRAPLSCQVPKLKDTKISLRGDLSLFCYHATQLIRLLNTKKLVLGTLPVPSKPSFL